MTALIGYARVSKADGSHDLQRDALIKAGVLPDQIHENAERELISERTKASLAAARALGRYVLWCPDGQHPAGSTRSSPISPHEKVS